MTPTESAYHALEHGVGLFDRSNRGRLDVTGPDRARFLHNLTTNEVKRMAVGRGHEAFVTSLQGKTLGYVTLLACDDRIVFRSDPGGLEALRPHLEKYGLFDDVTLDDVTAESFELHLAGPMADELLGRLGADLPGRDELAHAATRVGGIPVRVIRESPTGRPGLTLIGGANSTAPLVARLRDEGTAMGLAEGNRETFEAVRIEAGTPAFGQDVTPDNLPQELGRDARAISFVKGCYLGQEIVARIDALGHVNRHLKGLHLRGGAVPSAGATIEAGGKPVGTITSAAHSQGWGHPIALALIRTAHATTGTEVQLPRTGGTVTAVVADLPMLPPRRL
jgi:folate-binding protein YgfZ